jgi:hypothetical protein
MADASIVEPKTPAPEATAAPAAAEPTEEQSAAQASALPEEVLNLPVMQALFAGAPSAVSVPIEQFAKRPEAKLLAENKDALTRAGFGLYRNLGGDLGVIFNQLRISGAELQTADKSGKLLEIAPPFDQVAQQIGASGNQNPVLTAEPPKGGLATAPAPTPPQMGAQPAAPAASSQQRSRLKNLVSGGPSTGQKPGAGRLLNSILKPVL